MPISHHNLAAGEEACVCSWGERVVVDRNVFGFILETFEGWSAFTAGGELIGVRQRRAAAIAALTHRGVR